MKECDKVFSIYLKGIAVKRRKLGWFGRDGRARVAAGRMAGQSDCSHTSWSVIHSDSFPLFKPP